MSTRFFVENGRKSVCVAELSSIRQVTTPETTLNRQLLPDLHTGEQLDMRHWGPNPIFSSVRAAQDSHMIESFAATAMNRQDSGVNDSHGADMPSKPAHWSATVELPVSPA